MTSAKVIDQIEKLLSGKSVSKLVRTVCGEKIGAGLYRDVYVIKRFPDFVIKIERDPKDGSFANVAEWLNYNNHMDWVFLQDWLAECLVINETGQIMVQERVYWDGKKRKDYPKYIPCMFTDTKLKNFGWTKNEKFVCCDYSFFPVQIGKKKMKYAKWWGSLKK